MTTLKKFAAVVRLNIRLQLMDPTPTLILSIFPLVMIPFMEPAFKSMLLSDGYTNVTGVEQAIPGMAIFFSFLSVQTIIQSFFREYAWGMWPRLEASSTPQGAILAGKAFVAYLIQAVQVLTVLGLGALIFGYRPTGNVGALILVILAFSAVLAALGVALALWTPTEDIALSLSNIVGMLAAGIGGSFCTVSSFPDWAQSVAKFSPAYWALNAVHAVSLDGAGLTDVLPQIGMLGVFFVILAILVVIQFTLKKGQRSR